MIIGQMLKHKKIILSIILLIFITVFINLFSLQANQQNFNYIIDENGDVKSNLNLQIDDLKQMRDSITDELKKIEKRRNSLLNELDDLEKAIERFSSKLSSFERKSEFAEKKYYNDLMKFNKIEQEFENIINFIHLTGELTNKKDKIIPAFNSTHDIILNNTIYSLDSCFNYEKCYLNSKLNLYFINNHFNFNNKSKIFQTVESIENSCIAVIILKNNNDVEKLKNVFGILKTTNNLLIVNLMENYNVFDETFDKFKDNRINYFKCSLYASFSRFYKNNEERFDNLFVHFSLLDLSLNEKLTGIYNNQKQTKLLFTHKRKYLLSYYPGSLLVENYLKSGYFNRIDLNCGLSTCNDTSNRLESLSNSTFLLLSIKNESSNLWSFSQTARLIESLSVGTIPILLNLNSKLPLNELINWDEIIIRLSFEYISKIENILLNFNEAELIGRRIKAFKVYNSYFKTIEKQFETMLTSVRERIRLPAPALDYYKIQENVVIPQINNIKVNMADYYDKTLNDDEYLGQVIRNSTINRAFESKSFRLNFTFNSYLNWNKLYYPFNSFPSTPFDSFSPIDLKYSSINVKENPDEYYFYGGTKGGKYFNYKLAGNNDDYEQFTIIILTFKREKLLISLLVEYLNLPYLNQIVLIWNSVETKPSEKFYFIFKTELNSKLIRLVFGKGNSLNSRFLPYEFIKTDAILSLDDDTQLRNDEIIKNNKTFNFKFS